MVSAPPLRGRYRKALTGMPASFRKCSVAMCAVPPVPGRAIVYLPGCAFTSAIISCTFFHGESFITSMAMGPAHRPPSISKSV